MFVTSSPITRTWNEHATEHSLPTVTYHAILCSNLKYPCAITVSNPSKRSLVRYQRNGLENKWNAVPKHKRKRFQQMKIGGQLNAPVAFIPKRRPSNTLVCLYYAILKPSTKHGVSVLCSKGTYTSPRTTNFSVSIRTLKQATATFPTSFPLITFNYNQAAILQLTNVTVTKEQIYKQQT